MKKLFLFTIIFIAAACNVSAQNLIKNGNFSEVNGILPLNWTTDSYNKDDGVSFSVLKDENALKISSENVNHSFAMQEVKVEAGKKYRFSAKVKTEGIEGEGNGALLSLYYMVAYSNEVKGTTLDYQDIEMYFYSDTTTVPVILSLGGYGRMNKGTAYFKDVEITEVKDVPQGANLYHKKATAAASAPKQTTGNKGFDYNWIYLGIFLALVLTGSFCFIYIKKK